MPGQYLSHANPSRSHHARVRKILQRVGLRCSTIVTISTGKSAYGNDPGNSECRAIQKLFHPSNVMVLDNFIQSHLRSPPPLITITA
jgi:hypothetical protein